MDVVLQNYSVTLSNASIMGLAETSKAEVKFYYDPENGLIADSPWRWRKLSKSEKLELIYRADIMYYLVFVGSDYL